MARCHACGGKGFISVESGSGLCYDCPDCGSTGWLNDCPICGEEYLGDFCQECHAKCKECGDTVNGVDLIDGLCPDCEWERQQQKGA